MHDRFELWILSSCVGNISYMTSVRPVELHNVIGLEWSRETLLYSSGKQRYKLLQRNVPLK